MYGQAKAPRIVEEPVCGEAGATSSPAVLSHITLERVVKARLELRGFSVREVRAEGLPRFVWPGGTQDSVHLTSVSPVRLRL